MSAGSGERAPAPEGVGRRVAGGGGARDRLAALVSGRERPTAPCLDELLHAWRHAQQEVRRTYARWRELARRGRDGHPAYLAALDREERAAGVYAEVRGRARAPHSGMPEGTGG